MAVNGVNHPAGSSVSGSLPQEDRKWTSSARGRDRDGPGTGARVEDKVNVAVREERSSAGAQKELDDLFRADRVQLEYDVDDLSGRYLFKVYDKETGEVVRQVPPEEMLRIAREMRHLVGKLVSKMV